MTEIQQFSAAAQLTFSLVSLWWLVCVCFRSYRVDALRERLFALRDELFGYAADGGIAFDDPAYAKLRLLLNSVIRFAHQMTFARFAMIGLFAPEIPESGSSPMDEWRQALSRLTDQQKEELEGIHRRVEVLIVRHMAFGSPLLLFMLSLMVMAVLISGAAKRVGEAVLLLSDRSQRLDTFQSQTILADARERQSFAGRKLAHS